MANHSIYRLALACALAGSAGAANLYLVHNLVSDLPDVADHLDPNLVNPWGISFSATGPFWIGNNHSGTSTVYDGTGNPSTLVVTLPAPGGPSAQGAATGVLFNTTQSFPEATGKAASFLFCTEDGTILGWNPSVDATHAKILVDNSASGAVYKGCAIGTAAAAPILYAANFNSGKVDAWDGSFNPVKNAAGAFTDPAIPAGFAPFNIVNFAGKLYVSYAKQDSEKMDDVPGAGSGYITVYDGSGTLISHFIAKGALNSPWGMQIAPAGFGDFGGDLLVGNFGDGMINAFDPASGALMGTLQDSTGHPLKIPALWALQFGNGARTADPSTLYFTAGIPGPYGELFESHGLFGSIQATPAFQSKNVVNGASFTGSLAANTWASVIGNGLAITTRSWAATDFSGAKLPLQLDGTGVTVNGEAAAIGYISPTQIDFLVPVDAPQGPVQVQTTNNGLTGTAASVTLQAAAPAFFWLTGGKYVVALHANGAIAAPTAPVKAGETIELYATGLGVTAPAAPNGSIVDGPLPLVAQPVVTIGGATAQVTFAGLTAAGLYQINVVVPTGLPPGDAAVVLQVSGQQSQANAFLSIGQ